MSKIFATSDIHGNKTIVDKMIEFLKNRKDIQEIFLCGDLTGKHKVNSLEELTEKQIKDLDNFLYRLRNYAPCKFFYILGNDDWVDAMFDFNYQIEYLPFLSMPPYMEFEWVKITPFNTNREANENKIWYELLKIEDCYDINNNTIFVAHDPPYQCLDKCYDGREVGSKSVRKFIEKFQPKIWLCGHIHEDFGMDKIGDTFVFNCACDYIKNTLRGWVIDTETMVYEKIMI